MFVFLYFQTFGSLHCLNSINTRILHSCLQAKLHLPWISFSHLRKVTLRHNVSRALLYSTEPRRMRKRGGNFHGSRPDNSYFARVTGAAIHCTCCSSLLRVGSGLYGKSYSTKYPITSTKDELIFSIFQIAEMSSLWNDATCIPIYAGVCVSVNATPIILLLSTSIESKRIQSNIEYTLRY